MSAGQQRDHHRDAENELERGPQHAHQLHQAQCAADILAIEPLEEADLRLLAREGANQPHAGVILLGLRGNIGEAGLNALEALVNLASDILHEDAGQRHGRQRHQREPGTDAQHENQRKNAQENGVRAVHEPRTEQHAHRVQVVGHARHDVAGAIALVEARVLRFQLAEQVVAQVELDLARDPDQNPALRIHENALDQVDRDQKQGKEQNVLAGGSVLDGIHRHAQNAGELHGDNVRATQARAAPHVSPAVAAHVGVEWAKVAKHSSIVRFARCEPKPRYQMSGFRFQV